jgi:orotate phosphoribosyltransferase
MRRMTATMPTTMSRDELAKLIAEASLLRGTFTLRSGKTSNYYLDKYLFSTQPRVLAELGRMFAARVPMRTTRLAGAELGGIPLVSAASMATGMPCLFIRNQKKDYGTAKQLEGKLDRGDKVTIIEDVATTGGQALEAARVLREAGAEVLAIIATIDRLEGARENIEKEGIDFDALFTVRDLGVV